MDVESSSNAGMSGECIPPIVIKPFPYKPPLWLIKKGHDSVGDSLKQHQKCPTYFENLPNNLANQQLKNEIADLRRLILQNAQLLAQPMFKVTYQNSTLLISMNTIIFPSTSKCHLFPPSMEKIVVCLPETTSSNSQIIVWHSKTIPTTS